MYGFLSEQPERRPEDFCGACGEPWDEHNVGRGALEELLGDYEKARASNGHTGKPWSALGQPPIPWSDCFDQPGFNACHDAALRQAQADCQNYNPNRYDSRAACEEATKNVYVNADCLRFCRPVAAVYRGGDPCASPAAVAYMQRQLGVTVDGRFGPVTRAALERRGATMQGLIGCTGACPPSVPAGLCAGDCLPGFARDPQTGECMRVGPLPQPPPPAPPPPVAKKSRAGLVAALAALTIGGLVVYAQDA